MGAGALLCAVLGYFSVRPDGNANPAARAIAFGMLGALGGAIAGLVFGLVAAGVASLFSTVSGRPVKVPPGKLVTPVALDVHYCGRCREQQEKTKGDDCIYCGRRTVIWNPDRESEHGAHRRWADVNRES